MTLSTNAVSKDLIKVAKIDCQRVTSASTGFTSREGFERWFEKEIKIYNSLDNEFTLLDGWGFDYDKSSAAVKNSISKIRYRISTITLDLNEDSTQLYRYLETQGYKSTTPINYKCKKKGNTLIDLDQVRKIFK